MSTSSIHLVEIPIRGNEGQIWNRLHSEREDICEVMCKEASTAVDYKSQDKSPLNEVGTLNWHRELMQSRLRDVDDALDRMMSGSYGHCSKCGKQIEQAKLDVDLATALCAGCEPTTREEVTAPFVDCAESDTHVSGLIEGEASNETDFSAGIVLETQLPFDTICVQTKNTNYRILLLNPKTGRSMIEGGPYFPQPMDATVLGSSTRCCAFRTGWIGIGSRLEIWADERLISTSAVQSATVDHSLPIGFEGQTPLQYLSH